MRALAGTGARHGPAGAAAAAWPRPQRSSARRLLATRRGDVLLVAEEVSKTHDGDKLLFNNLSLTICAGDKLAVVGPNGAGKSTLLRVLAGRLDHDGGQISRNKGAKVGFLAQADVLQAATPDAPGGATSVLAAVLASDSALARASQGYQRALAEANGQLTPALEAAVQVMDDLGAWQVDAEALRVLAAVGLADPNAPVHSLSGGQRRRLSLASALLGSPSLLLLDEPTNHLDSATIAWLAAELAATQDMAVIMVSHDRAFMEATCNGLLELDAGGFTARHAFGGDGSYEAFKRARAERRAAQASAAADARTQLRREAEWMARQPKARSTKAKARVDAFAELSARARDVPAADLRVDFGRVGMARLGNKAVLLRGVSVSTPAGRPLLADFSYEFLPGQRLGVAGPNGAGKSTLLDVVAGLRQPQSGLREVGETAVLGYFQQEPPAVEGGLRLLDYIRSVAEKRRARADADAGPVDTPEVLLERLGFPRKRQFQKVESLSGGERRRLHLAAVLASSPNVLLLDEPTNDLDIATVEVLEEMLQAYRGLLLVVSHDRAFMDATTQRLLVLPGDGSVDVWGGTFGDYLQHLVKGQAHAAAAVSNTRLSGQAAVAALSGSSTGRSGAKGGGADGIGSDSGNGAASGAMAQVSTASAARSPHNAGRRGSSASASTSVKGGGRRLGLFEQEEYKRLGAELEALEARAATLGEELLGLSSGRGSLADVKAASVALAELQAEQEAKEERWLQLAEIAGDL